ncbi:23S rRNA (guanosine(2251)-2'-O)-methyltransferase RlmB [Maridesulfovibrio hydrothermalis]|uniref:RNA methyltransferase, TrmH family, group 3 n=1 Tax=Maridesulfovibrio hydrothermalis AM13 = DSM 14728 TaxID=1121451 RepID=L0RA18_9BACT|nr:23S rRNA (guanosine(2251)-2'-O)-methyltransferase RlmB [Maridesulfovibrio hydrothermalis]CCO23030.1 RNA methyltransferase, TrmH family, group 3 [Maridesulfovibrio hydrothermalis AM13 = DSM 14728]
MKRHPKDDENTIIAGRNPVQEMLLDSPEKIDLLYLQKGRQDKNFERTIQRCKKFGIKYKIADKTELGRIFSGNHQGVIARVAGLSYTDFDDILESITQAPLPLLLVLDQVQDPGNIGVLARSLYALGGAGIVTARHGGAFLGPASVKASAGALTRLPVARVANIAQSLDKALDLGINVYGAGLAEDSFSAYTAELSGPAILVLGNEEKGIRFNVEKRCQNLIHIPFRRKFDSLNVAQAGAMLISEFSRRLS